MLNEDGTDLLNPDVLIVAMAKALDEAECICFDRKRAIENPDDPYSWYIVDPTCPVCGTNGAKMIYVYNRVLKGVLWTQHPQPGLLPVADSELL